VSVADFYLAFIWGKKRVSKSRDIYSCLGFSQFLGSHENPVIFTRKSISIVQFV